MAAVLVVTSIGVPLPGSPLLLALGSFVALEELELWPVLLVAGGATILGDQAGYGIGRFGGRHAIDALARRSGQSAQIHRAEAFLSRWGAPGIFFSRWLVTALGPWVNLSSGVARYPWPRFLLWDVLGEALWVGGYVSLGLLFSDRVRALADLLGSLGWLLLALLVAVVAGWELARHYRGIARRLARHAPG